MSQISVSDPSSGDESAGFWSIHVLDDNGDVLVNQHLAPEVVESATELATTVLDEAAEGIAALVRDPDLARTVGDDMADAVEEALRGEEEP
jgi:hypothetical protein